MSGPGSGFESLSAHQGRNMNKLLFCLVAMTMAAPSFAQTVPPATPSLTIGAVNKGLRFDWEPVAGASWYQLEIKVHEKAQFVQIADDFDASVTWTSYRFPLHLYFWTPARYRLAACNAAGCTRSEEVPVASLRRDAVGYFKPAQTVTGARFAADTDMSDDGINFVSAAPGESIAASGGSRAGGAIYVFRRLGGTWTQRARLEPTIPPFIDGSNEMKVAISDNGQTVALGMPNYLHSEFDEQSGEVFVFHWNGSRYLRTRIYAGSRGHFGRWVGINAAGDTLAVAHGEYSNPALPPGVFIYKLVNGAWQPVRNLSNKAGRAEICGQGVISGDGSTIAESCDEAAAGTTAARVYVRTHSGTNWTKRIDLPLEMSVSSTSGYGHGGIAIDGTGHTIAAQIYAGNDGPAEVQVFEREDDGRYEKEQTVRPGAWRADAQRGFFGHSIALSTNGLVMAVGDPWDNGFGNGPRAAPLNPSASHTGAVYVYRYYDDWWWLYNMTKPNYHPDAAPYRTYGADVEFNANGNSMIVGEGGESSGATGVGGGWQNLDAPGSGAVWLY
jgi:hypothetical protein